MKDFIRTSSMKDALHESSSNVINLILDVFVLTEQLADLKQSLIEAKQRSSSQFSL